MGKYADLIDRYSLEEDVPERPPLTQELPQRPVGFGEAFSRLPETIGRKSDPNESFGQSVDRYANALFPVFAATDLARANQYSGVQAIPEITNMPDSGVLGGVKQELYRFRNVNVPEDYYQNITQGLNDWDENRKQLYAKANYMTETKLRYDQEKEQRNTNFARSGLTSAIENIPYQVQYGVGALLGAPYVVPGVITASNRFSELRAPRVALDASGRPQRTGEGSGLGEAVAKSAIAGVTEPIIERFGGEKVMGTLVRPASGGALKGLGWIANKATGGALARNVSRLKELGYRVADVSPPLSNAVRKVNEMFGVNTLGTEIFGEEGTQAAIDAVFNLQNEYDNAGVQNLGPATVDFIKNLPEMTVSLGLMVGAGHVASAPDAYKKRQSVKTGLRTLRDMGYDVPDDAALSKMTMDDMIPILNNERDKYQLRYFGPEGLGWHDKTVDEIAAMPPVSRAAEVDSLKNRWYDQQLTDLGLDENDKSTIMGMGEQARMDTVRDLMVTKQLSRGGYSAEQINGMNDTQRRDALQAVWSNELTAAAQESAPDVDVSGMTDQEKIQVIRNGGGRPPLQGQTQQFARPTAPLMRSTPLDVNQQADVLKRAEKDEARMEEVAAMPRRATGWDFVEQQFIKEPLVSISHALRRAGFDSNNQENRKRASELRKAAKEQAAQPNAPEPPQDTTKATPQEPPKPPLSKQPLVSKPEQVDTGASEDDWVDDTEQQAPATSQPDLFADASKMVDDQAVKPQSEVEDQPVNTNPTDAQKEAGNYQKGHIKRDGIDISIENPAGSVRRGTDKDGKAWETPVNHDYGYIKGTKGPDKDHVDVFIKPGSPEGGTVYVVNQNDPKTGKFDEPKAMIGFDNETEAREAYLSNYEKGWKGLRDIVPMTMDQFKEWAKSDAPAKGPAKAKNQSPDAGKMIETSDQSGEPTEMMQRAGDSGQAPGESRREMAEQIFQSYLGKRPKVVPTIRFKGSDGKWYRPNGVPSGVRLDTTQEQIEGYAYQGSDGVVYGPGGLKTEEEAKARLDEKEARDRKDFMDAVLSEPEDRWQERVANFEERQRRKELASEPLPPIKEKSKKNLKPVKPLGTGSEEDDARLRDLRARKKSGKGMGGYELSLKLLEEKVKADPSKWKSGDGVGRKVDRQINRGFRIREIDPDTKTAVIVQVADTGITSTGGDNDYIVPERVHIADLVRDRKYDAPKAGNAIESVKQTIRTVMKRMFNDGGTNYLIVDSMAKVPKKVREALAKQTGVSVDKARAHGFYYNGKVYFVADVLEESAKREGMDLETYVIAKAFHEYGIHLGLKQSAVKMWGPKAGEELSKLLNDIAASVGRERMLDMVGRKAYGSLSDEKLAEEYLAAIAERVGTNRITDTDRTAWETLLDWIRKYIQKLAGKRVLSDAEINDIVRYAIEGVGGKLGGDAAEAPAKAETKGEKQPWEMTRAEFDDWALVERNKILVKTDAVLDWVVASGMAKDRPSARNVDYPKIRQWAKDKGYDVPDFRPESEIPTVDEMYDVVKKRIARSSEPFAARDILREHGNFVRDEDANDATMVVVKAVDKLIKEGAVVQQPQVFHEEIKWVAAKAETKAGPETPETATVPTTMPPMGRFRPREAVQFSNPIVGPSGASLTSYEWAWMPEEYVDKRGEDRMRRVSDWEAAEQSSATGKDVVHKFGVTMPDGTSKVVSLESAIQLLGYANATAAIPVKSIASSVKTLAKNRLKLQVLQDKKSAFDAAKAEVDALPLPEAKRANDPRWTPTKGYWWKMGDVEAVDSDGTKDVISEDKLRYMASHWRDNRLRDRGFNPFERIDLSIRDLQNRIDKLQNKIGATIHEYTAAEENKPASPAAGVMRDSAPAKPKATTKARKSAKTYLTNYALKDFRERVRASGISYPKDVGIEDLGYHMRPYLRARNSGARSWDQWAQEAVDAGLLQPGYRMEDFAALFKGPVSQKRDLGKEWEEAAARRDLLGEEEKPEPEKPVASSNQGDMFGDEPRSVPQKNAPGQEDMFKDKWGRNKQPDPMNDDIPFSVAPSVDSDVRDAYLSVSKGQYQTRVRLKDLRPALSKYSREQQDMILKRMQREGKLVLYPLDDPQDRKQADKDAALDMGGEPRHIVYMNDFSADSSENMDSPDFIPFSVAPPVDSEAFKKWFGDSKVVDEDGKPLVVYHGTNSDFTVFDTRKMGEHATSEGMGFYFTNVRGRAQGYADKGGNVMKVYLSIEKPITDLEQSTITRSQLKRIFKLLYKNDPDALSNFGDVEFSGLDAVINDAIDIVENDSDIELIGGLVNGGIAPYNAIVNVVKKTTGYDGVILPWESVARESFPDERVYVAFNPTQIKSVYNTGTWDVTNPDIRFSVAESNDSAEEFAANVVERKLAKSEGGRKLLRSSKAFWADSVNARPELSTLQKYLGSPQRYFGKTWATDRMWAAQQRRHAVKHMLDLTFYGALDSNGRETGRDDMATVSRYSRGKATKQEYNQRWSKYVLRRDRDAIGYNVKETTPKVGTETTMWQVINPIGEVVGQQMDENAAWLAAYEYEKQDMANGVDYVRKGTDTIERVKVAPMSTAAANALYSFRKMLDRAYQHLRDKSERAEKAYLAAGEQIPTVDVDGEQVSIFDAMKQMGSRRGYYMPRIRQSGRYLLYAEKENEQPYFQTYTSSFMRNAAAAKRTADGWTVTKIESTQPGESILVDMSVVSMNALLQQAVERAEKDSRVDNSKPLSELGMKGRIETYTRKDGTQEKHFVIDDGFDNRWRPLVKTLGGGRYKSDGKWHITNDVENVEKVIGEIAHMEDARLKGSSLALGKAVAQEIAIMLEARGSRARKIGRREGVGMDVASGYEEDPVKAATMALTGIAGGTAKSEMAKTMLAAMMGIEKSWDDWREDRIGAKADAEGKTIKEYTAALENRAEYMRNLWQEYKAEVNERRLHPGTQRELFDDAKLWMATLLRNDSEWEKTFNTLRGLAALKFLTGIAPGVVNLTTLVTALPAAMHQEGKISFEDSLTLIPKIGARYTKYAIRAWKGANQTFVEDDEWLFKEMAKRGYDRALMHEEASQVFQNQFGRGWQTAVDWMMVAFSATERVNRGTSIAATYYAIKKNHKGTWNDDAREAALEQAKFISDQANATYGNENAPNIVRKLPVLKAAYTYRTYSHNLVQMMVEMGFSKEKRDLKALGYLWLSMGVLGGPAAAVAAVGGTLLVKALATGLAWMLGGEPPDDPEEALYDWAEEEFGSAGGRFARHGVAGLAGVDLSGSMSTRLVDGSVSNAWRKYLQNPAEAEQGLAENIGNTLLGPVGSMLFTYGESAVDAYNGDYQKAAEKVAPRILSSGMQAVREFDKGVTTRRGAPVYFGKEQLRPSPYAAALRALSFTPSEVSSKRQKQWNERQVQDRYELDRQEIYRQIDGWLDDPTHPTDVWYDILRKVEQYNLRRESRNANVPQITGPMIKARAARNRASATERNRGEDVETKQSTMPGYYDMLDRARE